LHFGIELASLLYQKARFAAIYHHLKCYVARLDGCGTLPRVFREAVSQTAFVPEDARNDAQGRGRLGAGGGILSYVFALLIGVVAGSRTFTPLAVVSWATRLQWLNLSGTAFAFLAPLVTAGILSLLAIGELIVDKLPNTPSRKAARGFVARIVSGALCGAALTLSAGGSWGGLVAGALGAVAGTFGFSELRARLVKVFGGRDLPAALLEDACAITAAVFIVAAMKGR
jgi:uncharacterized membrane protein